MSGCGVDSYLTLTLTLTIRYFFKEMSGIWGEGGGKHPEHEHPSCVNAVKENSWHLKLCQPGSCESWVKCSAHILNNVANTRFFCLALSSMQFWWPWVLQTRQKKGRDICPVFPYLNCSRLNVSSIYCMTLRGSELEITAASNSFLHGAQLVLT